MAVAHPHLPPGRAPGPQSLRKDTGSGLVVAGFVAMAIVWALFWLAFGSGPSGSSSGVGAPPAFLAPLVGGGGSVVLLGLAFRIHRARRPRPAPHLRVGVRPREVRRGERLEVDVDVSPGHGGPVGVGLVCIETYDAWSRSRSSQSAGERPTLVFREEPAYEHWEKVDAAAPAHLHFVVPPQAPFSYEGEALSFAWRVVARSTGSDREALEPVWVLP